MQVSETADVVSKYGRAKEMAYQMAKSAAQVKRDLENIFVGTAQAAAAGDASTARTMAGVQVQIDTSAIVYSGASDGSKPLIEADLVTCLQECYTNGADPSRVQVTPTNSVKVAAFASAAGRYRTFQNASAGDKTIVNVVNLYVSPFGEQKIEINRFLKAGNTLVFDPAMWSKATLRPWTRQPLAKTGDSNKQQLIGEFSLKHKNYKASGLVVEAVSGF